jgi:hypothetical protein
MNQPGHFPRLLDALARIFGILKLLRFQLLLVLFGIALSFVPAIHDAWYAAADRSGLELVRSLGGILVAAVATATANWYTSRLLLKFGLPSFPGVIDFHSRVSMWAAEQLPRLLGSAVLVIVGCTALSLGLWWEFGTLWVYGLFLLGVAVLFYWVLVKRRDWQKKEAVRTELERTQKKQATLRALWDELPPVQRAIGAVLATVIAASLLIGITFPQVIVWFGGKMNVIGIVLLGALLIAPVGTLLAYLSNYSRVPLFTLLLLYVVGISFINEQHDVRLCSGACAPVARRAAPVDLRTYAADWIAASKSQRPGRIPLIVVASEGGGVRAAYWTAAVLDFLERRSRATGDQRPFSRSVFAVSGVSGGSVGAVVFAGRSLPPNAADPCAALDGVFDTDVLSPTIATLFFTDLPKRFIPYPFGDDRAVTLETGWERYFCGLKRPFDELSPRNGAELRPLLLLNSTAVGSGRRVVLSTLGYASQAKFNTDFPEALDGARLLGTTSLPASSAALTSARFPLVSPAGVTHPQGEKPQDQGKVVRLVDGGYFDNSGTATARDVIRALRSLDPDGSALDIGVLIVRNDPKLVEKPRDSACTDESGLDYLEHAHSAAPDVASPLLAFVNAWSKGSDDLRRALLDDVSGRTLAPAGSAANPHVFELALYDLRTTDCFGPSPRLPLSWLLSRKSVIAMRAQLDKDFKLAAEAGFASPQFAIERNTQQVNALLEFVNSPR